MSVLPQVRPMLAAPGELPEEQSAWSFEMKWDGVRAIAYIEEGRLQLRARSDRDITVAYPELAGLGGQLAGRRCVLDGEIVAFDRVGRPVFEDLQPRIHVRDAAQAAALAQHHPVTYLIFDLLHLDDISLLTLPYTDRRGTLEGLRLEGDSWHTPPVFDGLGIQALEASAAHGLEGVVAKRADSRYEPGRRSESWVKVKHLRTQEVVVGGWRTGEGSRAGTLGSLLCGVYDSDGGLGYAGRVGTGFTLDRLAELRLRLDALASEVCPFGSTVPSEDVRDAHWVVPELVGEVAFAQWTRDGRLWHPRWRGLRPDKNAREVTRET